ncbi:MAG: hypothetical protein EBU90_03200 [Proteobacteria bacterium]|nr:hypothetical protein [Pseudomonadota bacterium]NBP13333.1 hypothetical protein [bacterium]
MELGHWRLSPGVVITENTFGFIYEICNTVTGRKYIGKKQCLTKLKRKPLKGKKNRRIEIIETDWQTYTGSSKELNEDIVKYGKQAFSFTILKACGSKWELGYREIKEQIERDVILREDYYNGILNVRIGTPPKDFKLD